MDFLDAIKNETIIICNNYVKNIILNMHKLLPIKLMTLNEFKEKYYFSYDEEAILFIMNEYHVKYEIAKEYISNLYYIENKHYGISKLDFLNDLKNKLINNDLLIYNDKFKEYAKRVDIIIYDTYLDNFSFNMFKDLHYQIIDRKYHNYPHEIFKFKTMEEEVSYVAHEIASLIDKGIDINHIKLTNIDKSYYNTINRIFTLFNLKVNIKNNRPLISYQIVKNFITKYQETSDISLSLEALDKDNPIYDELVKVINKYLKYNNQELLIYKLENSNITTEEYTNTIEIVDYLEYISNDDDYVFMLGFNEGIIPKYYSDTNYITDNICNIVGLSTTREKNKYLKNKILNNIHDMKNLVISLKDKDTKKTYYESILASNFNIIEKDIDNTISYSSLYDKMSLVNCYDNYFKFGEKTNNFDILNNNYQIKYNSFKHKFTGINDNQDKIYLSYSKMNMYNKCNFRYYLANILKLDIYEENFSAYIGKMVHFVMEKCLSNQDYDIDKYVTIFLDDKELTKKEAFFLNKYKNNIKDLLNQVLLEQDYSNFNKYLYEEKIDIDYANDMHFTGIIDKIKYLEDNNKTYLSLVDYKTGSDDISLSYLDYGINMQLPIYMYLASKLNLNNIIYTGIYLQKFNITKNDYRLEGYSNSDPEILSIQDNNYENSKIIKGMKTNKDGSFSRYAKVLSNDDFNAIIDKTKEEIGKAFENIKNSKYDINPKVIDNKNIACEFCKFKDICFKTKEDEVKITAHEFGGED